jgi:hypothetical protein
MRSGESVHRGMVRTGLAACSWSCAQNCAERLKPTPSPSERRTARFSPPPHNSFRSRFTGSQGVVP